MHFSRSDKVAFNATGCPKLVFVFAIYVFGKCLLHIRWETVRPRAERGKLCPSIIRIEGDMRSLEPTEQPDRVKRFNIAVIISICELKNHRVSFFLS